MAVYRNHRDERSSTRVKVSALGTAGAIVVCSGVAPGISRVQCDEGAAWRAVGCAPIRETFRRARSKH